jgi:hypothetical protein
LRDVDLSARVPQRQRSMAGGAHEGFDRIPIDISPRLTPIRIRSLTVEARPVAIEQVIDSVP